jgi:hypothetical protein
MATTSVTELDGWRLAFQLVRAPLSIGCCGGAGRSWSLRRKGFEATEYCFSPQERGAIAFTCRQCARRAGPNRWDSLPRVSNATRSGCFVRTNLLGLFESFAPRTGWAAESFLSDGRAKLAPVIGALRLPRRYRTLATKPGGRRVVLSVEMSSIARVSRLNRSTFSGRTQT